MASAIARPQSHRKLLGLRGQNPKIIKCGGHEGLVPENQGNLGKHSTGLLPPLGGVNAEKMRRSDIAGWLPHSLLTFCLTKFNCLIHIYH